MSRRRSLVRMLVRIASMVSCCLAVCLPAPRVLCGQEPLDLEERPEPLPAASARSEAEQDRVDAEAYYAHGRLLQQQGDLAGALARYQRSWRYNPDNVSLLKEIVTLALRLSRSSEAARYAVLSAERTAADPALLRNLAALVAAQGDYARAISLYEKSFSDEPVPPGPERDVEASAINARLTMGRLYFLLGDFQKAADSFAEVRDAALADNAANEALGEDLREALVDEASQTYGLFAETFLRAGRFDDALAAFEKADEASPSSPRLAYRKARVAAARGQDDEALALLEQALAAETLESLFDEGEAPYEFLRELLSKTAAPADEPSLRRLLIEKLAAAQAKERENPVLAAFLGREHLALQELERAAELLEAAVAAKPTALSIGDLAAALIAAGRTERLLEVLGQAALLKEQGDVLGPLVKRQAASGGELLNDDLMADLAAQAESRRESLPRGAALALGILSLRRAAAGGDSNTDPSSTDPSSTDPSSTEVGDRWFEVALEQSVPKKGDVLVAWGLELLFAKRYDRAAEIFRRTIGEGAARAQNGALYYYLAGALEAAGKIDEALAAARRAAALNPTSGEIRLRVGLILERAGRGDEAEKELRNLIERFDKENLDEARSARSVLSTLYVKAGRHKEGEELLEQLLDQNPEDPGALNDLGYTWVDRNVKLARSLDMIQRAVAAEPDNAAYRDSLGWAYYRLGRFEQAVAELKRSVELYAEERGENDAVIYEHLGDAELAAGRAEPALAAWNAALETAKKKNDAPAVERLERKLKK